MKGGLSLKAQSRSFERRICAQTQDLQIFKRFYMSQMNPKEAFHNTAYSVQLLRSKLLLLGWIRFQNRFFLIIK